MLGPPEGGQSRVWQLSPRTSDLSSNRNATYAQFPPAVHDGHNAIKPGVDYSWPALLSRSYFLLQFWGIHQQAVPSPFSGPLMQAMYPIYSISLRPSVRGYPANANLYTRLRSKASPLVIFFSRKKVSLISVSLSITQSIIPSSHQRLSIPWYAGTPHHDPLGVVLLVLVMLLVLVLFPRVRAQRHVRHVAQSVVVDTMLGLRRRWAVVA